MKKLSEFHRFFKSKRHVSMYVAVGLTIALSVAFAFTPYALKSKKNQHVGQSFFISGLKPADTISYKITFADGKIVKGEKAVDDNTLIFSGDVLGQAPIDKVNIGIDDAANLELTFDRLTKALDIHSSGLDVFSQFEAAHGESTLKSKADWSGALEARLKLSSNSKSSYDPVRLAFYAGNMSDAPENHKPLTIEILSAPDGGGPDDEGINDYDPEDPGDCDPPGPKMSTCDESRMDKALEKIIENYDTALLMMGEQLSAVAMQYVQSIGKFMDAKNQMETQRDHQRLVAEAHKDYHPSEQMCRFGSFIKSVATVEEKMMHEQQAMNKTLMETYLAGEFSSTAQGYGQDVETRLRQFRTTYCDPGDNNNGLEYLCQHNPEDKVVTDGERVGGQDAVRLNKDIDYARTIDFPLTLDVDFLDRNKTDDEEDVIALGKNLYWAQPFEHVNEKDIVNDYPEYLDLRRVVAMQNMAHNSYTHIIALKSRSLETPGDNGASYMKALLKEMGITSDQDINKYLGNYPGYYAQMDVLTKQMYQDPNFYTNLIDKPTNIERIIVALEAIKSMQTRDMHESSMRQEMLSSMLIEDGLAAQVDKVNGMTAAALIMRAQTRQ